MLHSPLKLSNLRCLRALDETRLASRATKQDQFASHVFYLVGFERAGLDTGCASDAPRFKNPF